MMKYIFLVLFMFSTFYGRCENDMLIINSFDTIPCFKLSRVAQTVDSISVKEKGLKGAQQLFLSKDYIFLQGMSSISQYTRSGKFVRIINCENFTLDIAGDVARNELYILTGHQGQYDLKCYDMHTGQLKRKFSLDSQDIISCVFFANELWMLRGAYQNSTIEYSLSKMNCQTGIIHNLVSFHKEIYSNGLAMISKGNFSIYKGRLFFSLNTDNTLYEIRGNNIVPYLQWGIEPKERYNPKHEIIQGKINVGRYLFIEYGLMPLTEEGQHEYYWFVKDLESNKMFNVQMLYKKGMCTRGTEDDICHSGHFTFHPLYSLPNHFYFTKSTDDGLTFYIVKVKE